MKAFLLFLFVSFPFLGFSQTKPEPVNQAMSRTVRAFLQTLTPEQRQQVSFNFEDEERFNWFFVPRQRKGLTLKKMTESQQQAAMAILKTALSDQGYAKATAIIDLENVLRVIEKRGPDDNYRDPTNYYFSVFGEPLEKESDQSKPWGWRMEGHHLSFQFSSITNQVLGMTPTFMGSNPGVVRADVPQKGKYILKSETELAYALIKALSKEQLTKAVISENCPNDIFTGNSRKASLAKIEGLPLAEMTSAQQKLFMDLLNTYLNNYHVTLKNQQLDKLKKAGLSKIAFAWAGDRDPEYGIAQPGPGKGQYYRIHGPTILIEYDNSQNNANHIHTVVRDLTNDFGEDLLMEHYRSQHAGKK
ncbi:DUF3500 domain-containing protein [Tellurirhabdus bombi]|uniref:DUF3500 domain-containing protein n=1 Tax=Tellurirhabdus bombi TaxID=2907205 RepID=UPI00286E0D85|nr:DUF3500 domain-containing protein [Tellurirhabdus bombi]